MRKFLRELVYIISFVIKPRKILVFSSYPDFADNPYALYLYFLKNRKYDEYKKVWILEQASPEIIRAIHEADTRTIISYSTLKNWFYVIISRYIFSSHNAYGYLHFRQIDKLMNLWHGLGIKKIGFDNGEVPAHFYESAVFTLATSSFFMDCMSSAFRIPKEHVLLTGLPRNDLLFNESPIYKQIVGRHHYSSVGIWMPTFRQTIKQDIMDAPMDEGAINYWNPIVLRDLDSFLQETNNFLILKLHPADTLQKTDMGRYANIRILGNQDIPARDLYPLVGKTDYLISDYSSIFVDYMTMEKPIGFLQNDTSVYKKGRLLYFEPTEENLPGCILRTIDDLKDFITNYKQKEIKHRDFLNVFKDADNCKRLVETLEL